MNIGSDGDGRLSVQMRSPIPGISDNVFLDVVIALALFILGIVLKLLGLK